MKRQTNKKTKQKAKKKKHSYIALYPVKIYNLAALYIINIKIHLTIRLKAKVL